MNMKRLVPVTIGLLLISGCAAMQSGPAEHRGLSQYDQDYIGAVNAMARKSGAKVIWVNPPRAKVQKNETE